MNLYGSKPQEQAMQRLIHDTNASLSGVRYQIEKLSAYAKANAGTIKGDIELFTRIEYLKSEEKRLMDAIDLYYQRFAADFAEEQELQPRHPKEVTVEELQKENAWLRKRLREYHEKDKKLYSWYRKTIEGLRAWKESAMNVMPDFQEIGKLLGIKLGRNVSPEIIPKIKELQSKVADLEKQLQAREKEAAFLNEKINEYGKQLQEAKEVIQEVEDVLDPYDTTPYLTIKRVIDKATPNKKH